LRKASLFMVTEWFRNVPATFRRGNEEIVVMILEEYSSENPSLPVRVRVVAPNGLVTSGEPAKAWREMHELLGIPPPQRPSDTPVAVETDPWPYESQNPHGETYPTAESGLDQDSKLDEKLILDSKDNDVKTENNPLSNATAMSPSDALSAASQSRSDLRFESSAGSIDDESEAGFSGITEDGYLDDESAADEELEAEEEEEEEEESWPINPNILRDGMLRMLNQPAPKPDPDPPPKISERDIAGIPRLRSEAETAQLMDDIESNIRLIEMREAAWKLAENLKRLQKANRATRCTHVKVNGQSCGSPALSGKPYCFFHAGAHAPGIDLPVIEDKASLRMAYTQLARRVAADKIDALQAKVLLQILESAARNFDDED